NANLDVGHEYYNIFSIETCAGLPGSGPFLGLCAADTSFLASSSCCPSAPRRSISSGRRHSSDGAGIRFLPSRSTVSASIGLEERWVPSRRSSASRFSESKPRAPSRLPRAGGRDLPATSFETACRGGALAPEDRKRAIHEPTSLPSGVGS